MLEIEDKVFLDILVIFNSGYSKPERYGSGARRKAEGTNQLPSKRRTSFIHDAECSDIYLRFKRFF